MNITPIPEREAANLIGVSPRTITNAVKRGDLVRIPSTGITPHVAREQAELFKGMKWVVRDNLSPTDRKIWEEVANTITSPGMAHQETYDPLAKWISQMPQESGMRRRVIVENEPIDEREVPKGSPFLQRREYIIA